MGAGYHLNQGSALMHELYPGQSLWAFTRASDGRYALAAELVIRAKTFNPPNFRYGKYRIWGDLQKSRYFQVDQQPNIEQVIRSLSLKTGAVYLGQSFQGNAAVRRISTSDHLTLTAVRKASSIGATRVHFARRKIGSDCPVGGSASCGKSRSHGTFGDCREKARVSFWVSHYQKQSTGPKAA